MQSKRSKKKKRDYSTLYVCTICCENHFKKSKINSKSGGKGDGYVYINICIRFIQSESDISLHKSRGLLNGLNFAAVDGVYTWLSLAICTRDIFFFFFTFLQACIHVRECAIEFLAQLY